MTIFLVLAIAVVILFMVFRANKKSTNDLSGQKLGDTVPTEKLVSAPAPAVEAGINEETVAAITAAIYSCMEAASSGSGVTYAISSIRRATGGRPVWGFAGMQQNTRPF